MKEIYILTDYKNQFGSNYDAIPYRSGFEHKRLSALFSGYGYQTNFIQMVDVQTAAIDWKNKLVLYTSNEEPGYFYKDYIEDVILYLGLRKAILVPHFELLRANNNKSFMELYKKHLFEGVDAIEAQSFGSLEDLSPRINDLKFPVVFKTSSGAMSTGVRLAYNKEELLKTIRKLAKTSSIKHLLKEWIRSKKHKGYLKNSKYQDKFILQPLVPNLKNDWKVLIFGEQVYILKRGVRENDFRASGSHVGYKAGSEADFPIEKLDSLMDFKNKINIPNLSIDYAFDGEKGYIIEFQGIYFGLSTHNYCNDYYIKENGAWISKPKVLDKEELFVYSIDYFLKANKLNL